MKYSAHNTTMKQAGGEILYIVKIGGNIIDDAVQLALFIQNFAAIPGKKILVHGGGKMATRIAEQLNHPQQMIEGRRVTDTETLKIITMVYAGYINKNIVAQLQAKKCNAIGLCGADGNSVQAHQRIHTIDFGFAGDVDCIDATFFDHLIHQGLFPVMAPLTHDGKGQLLNTNADTMAQELAKGLSELYQVHLMYIFEKNGVLRDAEDENSVIPQLNQTTYKQLKEKKQVFAGMIPKLDNAFHALSGGVKKVIIGKSEDIHQLISGEKGTTIIT